MHAIGTVGRMFCDTASSKFMDSLVQMFSYSQKTMCGTGEFIHYETAPASFHELGRNHLVEHMLGDWLLQLDTDHVFAPDLLTRLLELRYKYKAPVISGIYCYKFPPHAPVMNVWTEDGRVAPILDWDRKADVIEVGSVGAGVLLVDRWVFKKIEHECGTAPFTMFPGLSEDYSFCKRCKDLGIPVLVAPQIQSHHIITHVTSTTDYHPPSGATLQVGTVGGTVMVESS